MRSAALTLFDLTALNPETPRTCEWCGNKPATTRVCAVQNLLGLHPAGLMANAYRKAFHRAHSGPCCDACARYMASAWWGPTYACPRGTCWVWAHTLAHPRPSWNCTQHHTEHTVVWCTPLEQAL
ncbi:hypothetical protein K4B79_18840 [Streptomyces lincolnensis]|uniref:hypothetical protein n=1 Tax=Streptomyces lincolnensis TaxID=1915 RepID=UPI001E438D0C|nr:hypothetical protein [Streptomyces lincolnensis]MCD7440273.1 hypothetical protein [Streptomyces lincolnensis]